MQPIFGLPAVEGLVPSPEDIPSLNEPDHAPPQFLIDPDPVLRQHVDMFAQPLGLQSHFTLQRIRDFVQHRFHIQVQRGAFVVGQEFPGQAEAEGLPAADVHRRQRVGLACPAVAEGEGEGGSVPMTNTKGVGGSFPSGGFIIDLGADSNVGALQVWNWNGGAPDSVGFTQFDLYGATDSAAVTTAWC